MKYELRRRPSSMALVMPSSSNLKCRECSENGELRIGLSMTTGGKACPQISARINVKIRGGGGPCVVSRLGTLGHRDLGRSLRRPTST